MKSKGSHLTNALKISKIGKLKAIVHRHIEGEYKTCTIRRQGDKWFVCFVIEYEAKPLPESKEQIGIDVGLKEFAALSNGEMIANPPLLPQRRKSPCQSATQGGTPQSHPSTGAQSQSAQSQEGGAPHP
jgi:transposase